jgi:hypothetical protein
MFNKISYSQKNKLLVPVILVLVILCWLLAFNKTFEAIRMHAQLSDNNPPGDIDQDVSFNPNYLKRKLHALDLILESYSVNEKQWIDDVWLTVSALAASKKVDIDFTATKPITEIDSNTAGVRQSLLFYGDYLSLVKLLDTLEHTSRIGRISGVQISSQSKEVQTGTVDKCKMEVRLQGL